MKSRAYITTNVVGGLGNQLFLVANLLATSRRNGVPAVLTRVPWSSSNEQPRPVYWQSIFEDLHAHNVGSDVPKGIPEVIVPEQRPVAPVKLDTSKECVYNMVGFFQSEAFFSDYPVVQSVIPSRLREAAAKHLRDNYSDPSTVQHVGLHIRRGDYLRLRDVFEILEFDYYDAAVRQLLGHSLQLQSIQKRRGGIHLLVFSEEERYGSSVVGYFRSKYAGLEVSLVRAAGERVPFACGRHAPREVLELLMLSSCDDVVMSNSTWSWWAAYLNDRPLRRVVAPSKWFVQHPYPQSNHLYCQNWILL